MSSLEAGGDANANKSGRGLENDPCPFLLH